jgi:hypothetical protein
MGCHKDRFCHVDQTLVDQKDYWTALYQLSVIETEDYLRIYDTIALSKGINEGIRLMFNPDILTPKVYTLVGQLINLIEKMALARHAKNLEHFCQLQGYLDEINIAVNAWSNKVCLKHGAFLYGQYRQLRAYAKSASAN